MTSQSSNDAVVIDPSKIINLTDFELAECDVLKMGYDIEDPHVIWTDKQEKKLVQELWKVVPFPAYETLRLPLDLACNYDKPTHAYMKTCYENLLNPNELRSVGEKINNHGGFRAMQAGFYVLKLYACNNTPAPVKMLIKSYAFKISAAWHGIGHWQY